MDDKLPGGSVMIQTFVMVWPRRMVEPQSLVLNQNDEGIVLYGI